jgi:plasmid stabilization system protein ParE
LQEIFEYIERDSPQNASRMIRRIVESIDALEQFPHRYKVLEDIETFGVEVRSMPVPPYLIRYHVDEPNLTVTVLSVRHGARRPGL